MSLTSDLRMLDGFTRTFVDAHFSNLSAVSRECNVSLRPLGTFQTPHEFKAVSMLVGTAIDYRVRAYFRRNIHRSPVIQHGLESLRELPMIESEEFSKKGFRIIDRLKNPWYAPRRKRVVERLTAAFERFSTKVKLRRPLNAGAEDRMCRYCVLFARLDWISRSPFGSSNLTRMIERGGLSIPQMLQAEDSAIVSDVVKLSALFIERQRSLLKGARKVVLGKPLAGSADILGGADFDLIIDGLLLDFKTSLKPKITTEILRQLVGYWLLDYDDSHKIKSVGVLLMRHGHLQRFNISDLLTTKNISARALRAKFRDGLRLDKAERIERWDAEFNAKWDGIVRRQIKSPARGDPS